MWSTPTGKLAKSACRTSLIDSPKLSMPSPLNSTKSIDEQSEDGFEDAINSNKKRDKTPEKTQFQDKSLENISPINVSMCCLTHFPQKPSSNLKVVLARNEKQGICVEL